jgi:hypothetical protein
MDISKYYGSVFLKIEDIKAGGPRRVTIIDVQEGRYDKPDLHFDDDTCMGCNATNCRTLAKAYGTESDDWIGKEVKLTVGEVKYQGKLQEAILVTPISPPGNKRPPKPEPKADFGDDSIPF